MTKKTLKKHVERLSDLIKTINPVMGRVMPRVTPLDSLSHAFSNEVAEVLNRPYDVNIEYRVELQNTLIKISDKVFDEEVERARAELLEGKESADLKERLNSVVRLNNYYDPLSFIWIEHESIPNPSSYVDLTLQDVVSVLLPKTLILMHFDKLLEPATKKLAALKVKDKKNSVRHSAIVVAAQDMVFTALKARQAFIEAETVDEGLENIKLSMNKVYQRHEAVFVKHRGIHKNKGEYDLLNVVLDLFRGLRGVVAAVLTLPGWLWDPKGTQQFVSSFFERPKTASHQQFGKLSADMESLSSYLDHLKSKR